MHERTQRAVARLLFVFCCAVPTSIVLLSIPVTWTSWYQSRELDALTHRLGLQTGLAFQIERCQRIAPGKYVLENIRVSDPDSRQHVATIRTIDYVQSDELIAVRLHQPEFQSAGLGHAWTMIHDRLISRPARTVLPIRIEAFDANIISRTGSMPATEISATITPEGESVRMIARAQDYSRRTGPQIRVELFRDRKREIPATTLVLSTEGTALPCSALAEYAPAIKCLGPNALFSGVIQCAESPNGWSFDLKTSSLTHLSLNDMTDHLPHRVIGEAELHLRRCVIIPGQSVNIVGSIESSKPSSIRIPSSLLMALRDQLGTPVDESVLIANPNGVECDLSVDFDIHDETMTLTGIGSDTVLYSRGRPIALANPEPVSADRITAMLSPPSRWLVSWNQVLLPSTPLVRSDAHPSATIGSVRHLNGEASIRQQ